jgi:hypothetical protein
MLKKTCNDRSFNEVFKELQHNECLKLPNENFLKVYYTTIMNNKFEYSNLKKMLSNNITNYIFSRKENINAKEKEQIPLLTIEAIKQFRKISNSKDCGNGGELGEFLLYVFLESNLSAYKLLTKMELKTNSNEYIKGADGIYLYEYKDKNEDKHFNYIIGEAKINAKSSTAINEAFDSIIHHLSKDEFEKNLISREIFKEVFDEEDAERIKKIIVPEPNDNRDIQKAFGIFIGYELKLKLEDLDNIIGKEKILKKLEKDINNITKNLQNKIKGANLSNYSFYIYIMPFKNVKEDREEIIQYIIL